MQKLLVESTLPLPPAQAWEVFESDEFRRRLQEQAGTSSEVISVQNEGDIQVRTLKFVAGNELPKMVAKVLGTDRLTWEQTNRYNAAASRLEWDVKLPIGGSRVRVGGITTITPQGTGSHRVVDGTIEVKMRLIGGKIEDVVVKEFRKSMERAVQIALDIMNEAS